MNQAQFLENISRIHEIFSASEQHLNTLSQGILTAGSQRDILDDFLCELGLEKNSETYYIASARIGSKKYEPLDMYLEKQGASQEKRDTLFDASYRYVSRYYQNIQTQMLTKIQDEQLMPDFYSAILEHTHMLGKLYSDLFLKWNRKILFEQNRELESRFNNDQDAIIAYLEEHNLFDKGHHGKRADRSYSLLQKQGDNYVSMAYADIFPEEIKTISEAYSVFISKLESLEDEVFDRKTAYIEYFSAIQNAWNETNVNELVAAWSEVDVKWMAIDTPVQPGHPIEYYEDKYRQAVSIEFDMRLSDPSLFQSQVSGDIANMYEGMYDEIGRENFPESYKYSKNNQEQVQLHIGAPVFQYGSFLCGAYSAQVVPNDDEVSKVHGKKIFAFPKFVLDSQRSAPKMKVDSEIFSKEILERYESFLASSDANYYKIYDIQTIGHEFGHTLWLTPGCEVSMGESGLYKNIEEFKATSGGLVAHFLKHQKQPSSTQQTTPHPNPLLTGEGTSCNRDELPSHFSCKEKIVGGNLREQLEKLDEDIVVTHLMQSVKMMRYREVEDILPYYCECLIHLHILFNSGIISFDTGKIELHLHEQNFTALRELYIGVYTQQIFTYLNQMDAGNFLFEFVVRENGVFLPKDPDIRAFVEHYFDLYKQIGNEVV